MGVRRKDTASLDELQMGNGWYRLPDRELVKTRPELPVGTKIQFTRYIGRAGYRIEPADIRVEELNRLGGRIAVGASPGC